MKLKYESEWQYSLTKTYQAVSKLKCISDCSQTLNCKLITFNKLNNTCNYYSKYFNDDGQTNLIESNGDFIYDYKSNVYNLEGVQYRNVSAGCQVASLILLPNNNLASVCYNISGLIKIWRTATWASILSFQHGADVFQLAILRNKYLVSGGYDSLIKIWDFNNGQLINTISGHTGYVRSIAVLNNNDIASGSADFTAKIWDSVNRSLKFTLIESSSIYGLVQLKNGSLVTISWGGLIRTWNPYTGSLLNTINVTDSQTTVIQLKNGNLIIGNTKAQLKIYDSTTLELKNTLSSQTGWINGIIQLQNSDFASCSSGENTIKIWDFKSKTVKRTLTGHTNEVRSFAELPNGYLVSAGFDSRIIIWK